MGYLVSKYQHLFPQGTFGAPKRIETWSQSHRLFAQNQIREKNLHQQLALGITLNAGRTDFRGGGFANYRSWEVDPQKRKIQVEFFNGGEFPVKAFEGNRKLRLLTTLGYFYFTTNPKADETSPPKIKVNNLFIYRGRLLQLPVIDRSAFVIFKNGQVEIPFLRSRGSLKIGPRKFNWRGGKTLKGKSLLGELTVYNGSSGVIEPYNDPIIGPGRLAKKVLTPKKDAIDLIISLKGEKLQVSEIKNGGTEVTRGLWILSGPKNLLGKVKKGEIITEITIDSLRANEIQDAVSVGPQIFREEKRRQKQLLVEGLNNDQALCNRPHQEGLKLARAFLAKLKNGKLVSILIDGIPQVDNIYPGVTPQEAADFIFSRYPNIQKVVATDPGGTMKAVYKDLDGKTQVFGNLHYLDYRYHKDGTLDFWPNGLLGRKAVTFLGVS